MKVSSESSISMPMKNLISIIAAVAVGVWAYFGVVETLNKHSTELELMQKRAAKKAELNVKEAKEMAKKIESSNLTIAVTTGEDDKIHGTVTNIQIADALTEKGIDIDRRSITVDTDVKTLGEYTATIQLLADLKPQLKFWVVKAD